MRASQLMETPPVAVRDDTSLECVARYLVEGGMDSVPVVDSAGGVVGVVSRLDVLGALCKRLIAMNAPANEPAALPWKMQEERQPKPGTVDVRGVMRQCSYTAHQHTPAPILCCLMLEHNVKSIPIIGDNRVIGQVTDARLLECILSEGKDPIAG